jgi:hypothetical protein
VSLSQWIALMGGLPLVCLIGWIQSVRVWRRQADVSPGMTWLTGDAGTVGYHAFLLPATVACTLFWLGVLVVLIDGDHPGSPLDDVADILMILGIFAMVFGFWMWLFAWPASVCHRTCAGSQAGFEAPGWVGVPLAANPPPPTRITVRQRPGASTRADSRGMLIGMCARPEGGAVSTGHRSTSLTRGGCDGA